MAGALKICVVDGQGGKLGRLIIERIRENFPDCEITAVGTNAAATTNMLKGGADQGATGENPAVVAARTSDVIVGPVGMVIADSLLGEITPAMAAAIGQSRARRILIPINRCDNWIVGVPDLSVSVLVSGVIEALGEMAKPGS